MKKMLIKLDMQNNALNMYTAFLSTYYTEHYCIAIYGEIFSHDNECNNFHHIIKLYEEYGDAIVNHLEGLYHLFIFDKIQSTLQIYQDFFTSKEYLYYCKNNNTWYISSNLQTLLQESKIERLANTDAYCDFVQYGYVPNEQTLLQNVYKLAPFHKLSFTTSSVSQQELSYLMPKRSQTYGKEHWISDLNRSISLNTPNTPNITLPISGGYDSNYLLGYYVKHTNLPIHLFSIGGNADADETENVRKIVKCYSDFHPMLTLGYTSSQMLSHFPEIIWRLGGSLFERGIFLQYRLATELSNSKITDLVCGECADQIMNQYYQTSNTDSSYYQTHGKKNPYYYSSSIILKKSGILLNSFGINGHYPYINQRFVATASGIKNLNGTTKAFHQQICRQTLSKDVIKNIHKNGGATSLHALFTSKECMNDFLNKIEHCDLYRTIRDELRNLSGAPAKSSLSNHIITLKRRIFNGIPVILAKINAGSLHTLMPSYKKEERRLERAFSILYLLIFEELFCSSKSQHYLDTNTCTIQTDELLKEII